MLLTNAMVDNEKLKNVTIQRLNCAVTIKLPVNTSVLPILELNKVHLKLVLRRNKHETIILQDNLDILARESMYSHGYELFANSGTWVPLKVFPDVKLLLPIMIDLKTPINIMGSDEVFFEVNAQGGWMGAANVVPAECTIDCTWRDAIGIEYATPQIRCEYIPAGQGNVNLMMGDDITSVAFVNTNILTNLETTQPISQWSITSDKYNVNDTYPRMVNRRISQFDSVSEAFARGNTFVYIPDTEIDNARLNLTLLGANIAQGKNAVVIRSMLNDEFTYNRALALEAKHQGRDISKLNKQFLGDGNQS